MQQHPSTLQLLRAEFPKRMRIGMSDLAEVLDLHPTTIRAAVSSGSFAIKTYIDGKNRYADLRDVADFLDMRRGAGKRHVGRPTKAEIAARAAQK